MKQTNIRGLNYLSNKDMALELQPIAISQFYSKQWPGAKIVELDNDAKNALACLIDKGGADKVIRWPNGQLAFLAQRFRDWEHRNRNDFTIRDTELHKVINAINHSGFIASFYAYGYSNYERNGFYKFRIFRYREAVEYILAHKLNKGWIPNKDGAHPFVAIPFTKLPPELFLLYEDKYKQTELL